MSLKETGKPVGTTDFKPTYVFEVPGDYVEGVLGPARDVETRYGTRKVYEVGDYTIWPNAYLDRLLSEIPAGTLVGIEYLGTARTKDKKYEYKTFQVFVEMGALD